MPPPIIDAQPGPASGEALRGAAAQLDAACRRCKRTSGSGFVIAFRHAFAHPIRGVRYAYSHYRLPARMRRRSPTRHPVTPPIRVGAGNFPLLVQRQMVGTEQSKRTRTVATRARASSGREWKFDSADCDAVLGEVSFMDAVRFVGTMKCTFAMKNLNRRKTLRVSVYHSPVVQSKSTRVLRCPGALSGAALTASTSNPRLEYVAQWMTPSRFAT